MLDNIFTILRCPCNLLRIFKDSAYRSKTEFLLGQGSGVHFASDTDILYFSSVSFSLLSRLKTFFLWHCPFKPVFRIRFLFRIRTGFFFLSPDPDRPKIRIRSGKIRIRIRSREKNVPKLELKKKKCYISYLALLTLSFLVRLLWNLIKTII